MFHPSRTPFLHENDTKSITINPILDSFPSFHSPNYPPLIQHEGDEEALFLQNLHDLLNDQQEQPPFSTNVNLVPETTITANDNKMGDEEKCAKNILEEDQERSKLVNKNSSSKKDRHSKIDTSNGPRERRMRLPVDVARRFFGLQDLLGFNKPSRTVEWLLTNSESAIKQLKNTSNITTTKTTTTTTTTTTSIKCGITSSDQYCEVLSGIDKSPLATLIGSTSSGRKERRIKKISTSRGFGNGCRKITSALIRRESREKARKRARERTREKNMQKRIINNREFNLFTCREGMDMDIYMDMDMDVSNLSQLGFLESIGEDQEDTFGDSLLIGGNNWTHYPTSFIHQHNPAISHEQEEQHQLADSITLRCTATTPK